MIHKLLALTIPNPPSGDKIPSPVTDVGKDVPLLADSIGNWLFWGLIIFAVIMFFIGGYRYVTSGGEPERVKQANKTLLYAAIAVVVAVVANGIPLLVASFFGVSW